MKTRLYEDKSDFRRLLVGLNLNDKERPTFLFDNINIPAMVNYLAATVIMHDNDHVGKNYYLYRDSDGSGEWQMLPWDKDLTFGRNFTGDFRYLVDTIWADEDPFSHPLFGDSDHRKVDRQWNLLIDVLYEEPRIQAMMARRLRTLMDELLQPLQTPPEERYYEQRIEELFRQIEGDADLDRAYWGQPWGTNQNFRRALDKLKSLYLDPRRVHLSQTHGPENGGMIPAAQPRSAQIAIGPHTLDYTTPRSDTEYLTLINQNDFAVDISGWSLEGAITHSFPPGTVIVPSDTLYLSPNINAFRNRPQSPTGNEERFAQGNYSGRLSARPGLITLYNRRGELVDSHSYTTPSSPFARQVVVSEINYAPIKADVSGQGDFGSADFEFIELYNRGTDAVDLAGFRFIDGIEYLFPEGSLLASDEHLILARNRPAMQTRYSSIEIFGTYAKKLDNQGERITFVDQRGRLVFTFSYGTAGAWPNIPKSQGHTLVRVGFDMYAGDPCSWRASSNRYGSPTAADPPGPQTNCVGRLFLPSVQTGH